MACLEQFVSALPDIVYASVAPLLSGSTWYRLSCKASGFATVLAGQKTGCWHSAQGLESACSWRSFTACLRLRAGHCCAAGLRRTRKRSLPCTSSPGMPASADDPQLDSAIAAALQEQEETGEAGRSRLLQLFHAEASMHGCSWPQHCGCRSGQGGCVRRAALRLTRPA